MVKYLCQAPGWFELIKKEKYEDAASGIDIHRR